MARRPFRFAWLLFAPTVLACGASPTPGAAPAAAPSPAASGPVAPTASTEPAPRRLDAETSFPTKRGGTFRAPAGWLVVEKDEATSLVSPDAELSVTFVDVESNDPEAAVAQAWQLAFPGFDGKSRGFDRPPPRDGWDAVAETAYEDRAGGRPVAVASAFRFGPIQHVVLFEGTRAGFERRIGAALTAMTSLTVAGMETESFAERPVAILDPTRLETFGAFVEEARAALRVPGASFAVVQGNRIVLEKGLGALTKGAPAKVTPSTRFLIGSVTKSLTTFMMARLVDEKRFAWDTLASKVDPTLKLATPELTAALTMQHLVCACTGLPRRDLEFMFGYRGATPERRVRELATLMPTTAVGEAFQYSNSLVAAAGYVAARAAEPKSTSYGAAYDKVMASRVFRPLGMTRTTFDFAVATKGEHASPHSLDLDGEPVPIALADELWLPSIRPAGGAWSTAGDLGRWAAAEIERGHDAKGKAVVSEASLTARWRPRIGINAKTAYGLGLVVASYKGIPVLGHSGGTLGFGSEVFILPKHGVALVVLTNDVAHGHDLTRVVFERFVEVAFGSLGDASQLLSFMVETQRKNAAKAKEGIRLATDTDLANVLGDYASAALGAVKLRADKGSVRFDTGEWSSLVGVRGEGVSRKLVLVEAPWTGLEMSALGEPGARKLVIEMPQERYELVEGKPAPNGTKG